MSLVGVNTTALTWRSFISSFFFLKLKLVFVLEETLIDLCYSVSQGPLWWHSSHLRCVKVRRPKTSNKVSASHKPFSCSNPQHLGASSFHSTSFSCPSFFTTFLPFLWTQQTESHLAQLTPSFTLSEGGRVNKHKHLQQWTKIQERTLSNDKKISWSYVGEYPTLSAIFCKNLKRQSGVI